MVGRKGTRYEERRRKTLEENKKRMEELNLNKLSQSLCKPGKKVKPRPPRQPVDISLVRRSTRVADISYREKVEETIAQKKLNEDLAKDDSDSKAMKRPPSAFFIFMRKFRNLFKQNFPENKSVFAVRKAAGEEWRSMSDSDKAPYVAMAAKKKAVYEKAKEEFKNKTKVVETIAQKKLNEDLAKDDSSDDSDSKAMKRPHRPPSAFFVFMGEFRNLFKQNFPENKSVAAAALANEYTHWPFTCVFGFWRVAAAKADLNYIGLQTTEQQVHLQDALNDALKEEIQHIKLLTGRNIANGGPIMNYPPSYGTNQQFYSNNPSMHTMLTAQQFQQLEIHNQKQHHQFQQHQLHQFQQQPLKQQQQQEQHLSHSGDLKMKGSMSSSSSNHFVDYPLPFKNSRREQRGVIYFNT